MLVKYYVFSFFLVKKLSAGGFLVPLKNHLSKFLDPQNHWSKVH